MLTLESKLSKAKRDQATAKVEIKAHKAELGKIDKKINTFKTSKNDVSTTEASNDKVAEDQYKEDVDNIKKKYDDMIKRMEKIVTECNDQLDALAGSNSAAHYTFMVDESWSTNRFFT